MEELYPNLVPPQNIEAEEAVLGLFFLQCPDCFGYGILTPEDFIVFLIQLILRQ